MIRQLGPNMQEIVGTNLHACQIYYKRLDLKLLSSEEESDANAPTHHKPNVLKDGYLMDNSRRTTMIYNVLI